jgi:hypothetical protein
MNTPGFTAEASLYKTSRHYHMAGAYSQIAEGILPGQGTGPRTGPNRRRGTWPEEETVSFRPTTPRPSHCMWGHWCGPNCGGGPVQDDLDSCCRAHDRCYEGSDGLGPCSCDLELIACAAGEAVKFWDPEKALAAAAVVAVFTTKVGHGLCSPSGGGGGGGGGGAGGGGTIGNGRPRQMN